ncbi:MAG: hypothetical protein ACRBN8_39995 [Nannocystales bacterium]
MTTPSHGRGAHPSLLALALACCNPPAGTVGGWTSDEGQDASSGPLPQTTTTAPDATTVGTAAAADTTTGMLESADSSGIGSSSTTGSTSEAPPWVATVGGPESRLLALDLTSGHMLEVCDQPMADPDALTWLPSGLLVGSSTDPVALWTLDPCTCETSPLDPLDPPAMFHSIATAGDDTIEGVDEMRQALLRVDLAQPAIVASLDLVGIGTVVGLASGAAATQFHALTDVGEFRIRTLDTNAGTLGTDIPLSRALNEPGGLTSSPLDDDVLTCDAQGRMWSLDPMTGDVDMTPHGFDAPCHGLAAPRVAVACVDSLF